MRKFFAVIVVCIIALCAFGVSIIGFRDAVPSIKVISFNIRMATIEDERMNDWDYRTDSVMAILNREQPDLIGFQEVKPHQFTFLKNSLPDYGWYGVNRDKSGVFSEAVTVFYKKSRFRLIEESTFWLSETPDTMSLGWDGQCYRTCTEVRLYDKKARKELSFFSTHLDHKGEIARDNSISLLNERVNNLDRAAILSGDFNFEEDSAAYTLMTEFFDDTKYLAADSDTGGTFQNFGRSEGLFPIDFIVVSPGYFTVDSYKIIRDRNEKGTYPSDHFPIMSVLRYI